MKQFILSMLMCLLTVSMLQAQDVEMADALRSNGKIYVVVSSMVILFVGLAIYLVRLDLKVKQWEKK